MQQMGERFARALADRDADRLKALLRSDVDFGALTPGKFWEAADADSVVEEILLGEWFQPEDRITRVIHVDTDRVGPRQRVGYRFVVQSPDGAFLVEQQAYFETDADRISWLRILCSGYLPVEPVDRQPT